MECLDEPCWTVVIISQIITVRFPSVFTDWRRTTRSILLQKIFYGLAADGQEYCLTTDFLRTGGGPPGKLPSKKIKCRFFGEFFKFSVKANK